MLTEIAAGVSLISAAFILYMKFGGGQQKMFYKPKADRVRFENEELTGITTKTHDGVQLGGFLIHPKNRLECS